MIQRRYWLAISSNNNRFFRFRRLGNCFMAAGSNFLLGQRDCQMSLTRFSSNVSTSSVIGLSNGGIFTNGFRLKGCCSENYGNVLNNSNDLKIDHVNCNGVKKARAYGPCLPQLMRVSEEIVKAEEQQKSLNSRAVNGGGGAANRGSFAGVLDHPSLEKIMVAVDVDEVLGNFVSALNQFIADRYSHNLSVSEYHVYEFFKIWNCSRDEDGFGLSKYFCFSCGS